MPIGSRTIKRRTIGTRTTGSKWFPVEIYEFTKGGKVRKVKSGKVLASSRENAAEAMHTMMPVSQRRGRFITVLKTETSASGKMFSAATGKAITGRATPSKL